MKIVHVLTRGDVLGGAQSHVRELSLELRALGHDVTVITGAPGLFTDQLRDDGIPCLHMKSLVRALRPHRDVAALIELWNALRKLKPDLVCAHTAKAGSLGRAAARLHHIPSVFTPHGWSIFDRTALETNPLHCWMEQMAGHLGTRVINVCEAERDVARQYHVCPPKQLDVVHNGIADSPDLRTRAVEAQPPVIVMVARFATQKDHATLLHALTTLQSLEWTLQLVGGGELQPDIIAQLKTPGLRDRVSILPANTNVGRLLMETQLFVLSTHFEALPISILEAMRAALPVIATDVGGIHEAVIHERNGLLVPRADIPALRSALARLIASPSQRAAMGAAGKQRWKEHFTATTMAARTIEVYNRALASRRRSIPLDSPTSSS
jgi:glycosyltransferase involved in cell wall biosynthesis